MSPRSAAIGLGIACLLSTTGCVRLSYSAGWRDQPIDPSRLADLHIGEDDLTTCLSALGAPHFVWEYRGDGVALGWVHGSAGDWSVQVSYSFGSMRSVSIQYGQGALDLPGVVLWFDPQLRLLEWREGSLAELTTGLRRAAPFDDEPR